MAIRNILPLNVKAAPFAATFKNTGNSTAGAVRVEANLLETSAVVARFLLQMHNKVLALKICEILAFQICYFENLGQGFCVQHSQ